MLNLREQPFSFRITKWLIKFTNLLQAKYECALKHQDTIKIVTPSWVTDCIKNKEKLDEAEYLPSEEDDNKTDSILTPDSNGKTTSVSMAVSSSHNVLLAVTASSPTVSSPKATTTLPSALMSPVSPVVTIVRDSRLAGAGAENKTDEAKTASSVVHQHKEQDDCNVSKVSETPNTVAKSVKIDGEGEHEEHSPQSTVHQSLNNNKENREDEMTRKTEGELTQQENTDKGTYCTAPCQLHKPCVHLKSIFVFTLFCLILEDPRLSTYIYSTCSVQVLVVYLFVCLFV